ncbi:MAG: type II secretion system protein [Verrucomicrobiales bacterium]
MKSPIVGHSRKASAFTLLELLTVIVIISILVGMIFAAGPAIMRSARRSSAKSDMEQLVIAINSFYSEYGRYPVDPGMQGSDVFMGPGGGTSNGSLMAVLLADPTGWNAGHKLNPKRIVFLNPSTAKESAKGPRNGLGLDGNYYDMWGNQYRIIIDTDYDNVLNSPNNKSFDYIDMGVTQNGVFNHVGGVIIVSYGEDEEMGKEGDSNYKGSDDIASWL